MHLEKFWLYQIQNGHLSAIIHFHIAVGNRTRWLDHKYKTKCEISGEDASWKNLLDQIQNGLLSAIVHFHMGDIW